MLTWLVSTSLRLRVVVLALCVVLLVVGARSMRSAPFDVFPEFAPPYIEIQTEAPGLSTTEVESLVTMPLENVLYGMPGLKTNNSIATGGGAMAAWFKDSEGNIMAVVQRVPS